MELEWAAQLRSQPGMERVMTAGALLSPDSQMPADHLVRRLLVQKQWERTYRTMPSVRQHRATWITS